VAATTVRQRYQAYRIDEHCQSTVVSRHGSTVDCRPQLVFTFLPDLAFVPLLFSTSLTNTRGSWSPLLSSDGRFFSRPLSSKFLIYMLVCCFFLLSVAPLVSCHSLEGGACYLQ